MVPSNEATGPLPQSSLRPSQFTGCCERDSAPVRVLNGQCGKLGESGWFVPRVGGETAAADWRDIQSVSYTVHDWFIKSISGAVTTVGVLQRLGVTCLCGKLLERRKESVTVEL